MIRPSAYPIFDPAGIAASKPTNSVKVIQTEGMHDSAIITLVGAAMDAPELQPGTPVQMQYGWSSVDLEWFYGYVDHIESHYDRSLADASTTEDVVCLGASYSLKEPFTGSWTGVRASDLVKRIADRYFLSTVVEDDDCTWPQVANPGYSAWTFFTQLASKVGYSLACNKTLIRFNSVDLAMRRYSSSMPVFKSRKVAPSYAEQTLTQFKALTGESPGVSDNVKSVRYISGMNLATGQIVGATNDSTSMSSLGKTAIYPFFSEQISTAVVSGQGHAQNILAGMTEANRFSYQATATLSGLTAVHQGMPVVISGIDTNSDGVWWVQEVSHNILNESYSLEVCLGRDSKGDSGLRPSQGTSIAFTPRNPLSYSIANAPPTRLVTNRWRAAYQSNVGLS